MKVMTFNLRTDFVLDFNNRWSKRADIVYKIIEMYDCDIIGVQELNNKMHKDFLSNIKDYNIIGKPRSNKIFIERNDLLIHKKHKIINYKTFWLSENPNEMGSSIWYSLFPRICTTALVKLDTGELIRVFNTHLDCLLPKAREYGLKKIMKYMEEGEQIPSILMGDFNANPNSKIIKDINVGKYNSNKFIAVQESKREIYELSTMSNFNGNKKGLHIDYIFVSEDFHIVDTEIVDFNINGRYPSDHYPLVSEMYLKNR